MRYMTLHKIKTVCIVALSNYDVKDKTVIILGAGGVVPSIVYALKKMNASVQTR